MNPSSDNIQVYVRVRPFQTKELQCGGLEKCIVSIVDNNAVVVTHPNTLQSPASGKIQQVFTFDKCFWSVAEKDSVDESNKLKKKTTSQSQSPPATQEDVYSQVGEPVLQNILVGYNGCIMAYGQSGSGKTYTMMGESNSGIHVQSADSLSETLLSQAPSSGIIPRICHALFQNIRQCGEIQYQVEMSYMEIYAEQIRDLLIPSGVIAQKPIRIREHPKTGPFVENLTRVQVYNYEMIEEFMVSGSKQRITASTNLNDRSSRAHSMFTLHIKQCKLDPNASRNVNSLIQNKLCLVDLAGSERVHASGVSGIHLQEASNINTSLTALGRVISILAKNKESFVPFRDSSLTWMLKDTLCGNSKTVMIATLSPSHLHYEETLSTLQYAYRTKQIVNRVSVNTVRDKMMISKLAKELETLNETWTSVQSVHLRQHPVSTLKEKSKIRELVEDRIKWNSAVEESKELHKKSIEKYKEQFEIIQTSLQFPFLLIISESEIGQELVHYLQPGTTSASIIHSQFTFKFFNDKDTGVWLVPMDESQVILVNNVNIEDEPQLLAHGDKIVIDPGKSLETVMKFKIPICAIK